jgi:Protein of unknown function (DUF4232)
VRPPASHHRPRSTTRRACQQLSLTVATAAAIAGLGACGSPVSNTHAAPATLATPPTTRSMAATAPAAIAGSAGGTPASAAPVTCAAHNLHIANSSFYNGAGGFSSGILILVNKGRHTCILDGYPGVELVDGHGRVITNAARRCAYLHCPATPTRVTLAPGHFAHFEYVWQDNPPEPRQRTCPQSRTALVTPPNAYDHQAVPLHIAPCGIPPVFGVGTVQAGPAPNS